MQVKTTGIVLHSIKHGDSSIIITVYTEQFGRVAYMIHGANKKKSVVRSALIQPLSIVEMDVFHSPGKDIQRIKDIRMKYQFNGIPIHPVKNSLALFVSEMLYRVLRQTEPDERLFLFLENSIQQLDHCDVGLANFHLVFLLKLTRYLGFEPNADSDHSKYFDLMNGIFQLEKPLHTHYLLPEPTNYFAEVLEADYSTMQNLAFSRAVRMQLLESIIEYYRLHIPEFKGLNSLSILQSLFD